MSMDDVFKELEKPVPEADCPKPNLGYVVDITDYPKIAAMGPYEHLIDATLKANSLCGQGRIALWIWTNKGEKYARRPEVIKEHCRLPASWFAEREKNAHKAD